MAKLTTTPGVYIKEKAAFPNSAVPVPTGVSAFIGYTEKAIRDNKSLKNIPTRLSSFTEFLLYFGGPPPTKYELSADAVSKFKLRNPKSRFLLFHSMKCFFANGGSDCYVVSIGDYSGGINKSDFGELSSTKDIGLRTLLKETEPSLVVIPDAVLLSKTDCADIQKEMLSLCGTMKSCFAILDVPMSDEDIRQPDTAGIVKTFRNNIGANNLQWGAAYYPYLETTVMELDEVSWQNIDPKSMDTLAALVLADVDGTKTDAVKKVLQTLVAPDLAAAKTTHQTLLAISPLYAELMKSIRQEINILPPSGSMAGVYAMVDHSIGVFQSPANVSIGSVVKPVVNLSNSEQEDLNVPLDGKAVNAIRSFPGKGVLVWGARTLDGNSQDWRYIAVRRTAIFIEQSIKYAIQPYVFEPNNEKTWEQIKALVTNFLTNTWRDGALAGASADEAFSVKIGLGVTMTPVDILDGILRVSVQIAITRPAEFIVITFQQKMQQK